ncbi:MAG TPA: aminoglycoside phosphotransferase family protein [Solirubrobacteraceae bacterium]|nr:aminoglycoside phosphotransferase family protein [Solirubrobacteraceae bacterium]
MITIPQALIDAVAEDDVPARDPWLAALPEVIQDIAAEWGLELGEPYVPGGHCAWVAPARARTGAGAGGEAVLKVGWRHWEAEHEADALALWNGDGAVRCAAARSLGDTTALLLERCRPGTLLVNSLPEPEQDVVLAGLMRRLWEHCPPDDRPFASLEEMCDRWAGAFELDFAADHRGLDPGLAREGMAMLRELPGTAGERVLLSTDLHAGNVLASEREPWLVIDPKPFVGDPAYDAVQHMLNCSDRLAADPLALAGRMAGLLEVDPERVGLWLFARCVQQSLRDVTMREPARRLGRRRPPARR